MAFCFGGVDIVTASSVEMFSKAAKKWEHLFHLKSHL